MKMPDLDQKYYLPLGPWKLVEDKVLNPKNWLFCPKMKSKKDTEKQINR